MGNAHTIEELRQLQAMPLSIKIRMTENRIREWVREYGVDGVYVSFSGGKDSTVLLDIARRLYPQIKAVFVDTGLEYPEIRDFVKRFDNVDWIKPDLTFKQVITKYGYPFASKETAESVESAKICLQDMAKQDDPSKRVRYLSSYQKLTGSGVYDKASGNVKNRYNQKKWEFLLDAPFNVSKRCCNIMKKEPAHRYSKVTGRKGILATLAIESRLRTQKWLQNGCNGFNNHYPVSNPMSFWTEQDVLRYIYINKLPIASVYGQVVPKQDQISLFENDNELKMTGVERTGCVFCGFGCHLEKESRFVKLKETHPQLYNYIMKPVYEGGLGYKDIIDWINEHGNMNIKY